MTGCRPFQCVNRIRYVNTFYEHMNHCLCYLHGINYCSLIILSIYEQCDTKSTDTDCFVEAKIDSSNNCVKKKN